MKDGLWDRGGFVPHGSKEVMDEGSNLRKIFMR